MSSSQAHLRTTRVEMNGERLCVFSGDSPPVAACVTEGQTVAEFRAMLSLSLASSGLEADVSYSRSANLRP